ncbi:major facilitator superfamily domain-containing protein [Aspergillus caelatus]|uniref:Major facilitator superfamily domain-containing protein n=1 Tax=Aspergillus caelatus TaxID=61420 RepID=A0A5N6ZUN5_9EURO|nr:major facilitator superfamily domain-containing protein [Aspergillus caelatus]KAE8360983.1 major facilitator superfamily domain-containing protein [Aspergillus caelatus]
MTQATLRTERLELVPLGPEDLKFTMLLDKDPDVMKYIGFGKPLDHKQAIEVHQWLLNSATIVPGFGCWVGFAGGEFVGWWILAPCPSEGTEQFSKDRSEFGYRLLPKFWGQGYAKEGSRELLRHAFQDLGLSEVIGETMAVNAASRAVMAACGLKHVHTFYNKYDSPPPGIEEGEVRFQQLVGRQQPSGTHEAPTVEDIETPVTVNAAPYDKEGATGSPQDNTASSDDDKSLPHEDAQRGVKKIEAVTLAWSKATLAMFLILYFLPPMTLTCGGMSSILASLTPYATSDFQSHSLLTVIEIVASAMTSAVYIPMAKMLDVWGRAEGFLLMLCFATLGLILMAASNNLPTFCAAQVFQSVGLGGMTYSINVLSADVTNLRNRGLAFAFVSSPWMITAFAGSKAAEEFLLHVNWRWGFGSFAIIIPAVSIPVYTVLKVNLLPGVILFAAGLTVFLLPFTLARSAPNGWKSDYIIAMIVVGFVLLLLFAAYQVYLAPVPFLKHDYLINRTVLGACLLDFVYQMSYYCWNSYFTSFLQVVNNLSVSEAGYVNSTFQVVSGVLLFIVGYLIRKTGYFRWLLWIGVPLYIFAQGLMIHFRQPNGYIGYIVMCEIFISIGGSVFTLCMQLAVLAAVDHQHVAAAMAILFVSGGIGGAVGNAISGAIWTNTFENSLANYLPESALPNLTSIYASLPVQLSYAVNSPERIAIQKAYGYSQTRMLAAGTGLMALAFVAVFMIRNLNLKNMTQTKGVVF